MTHPIVVSADRVEHGEHVTLLRDVSAVRVERVTAVPWVAWSLVFVVAALGASTLAGASYLAGEDASGARFFGWALTVLAFVLGLVVLSRPMTRWALVVTVDGRDVVAASSATERDVYRAAADVASLAMSPQR